MSLLNQVARAVARRKLSDEAFKKAEYAASIPAVHMWAAVVRMCVPFMEEFYCHLRDLTYGGAQRLSERGYVFKKGSRPGYIRVYSTAKVCNGYGIDVNDRTVSVWNPDVHADILAVREAALTDERTAIPWVKSAAITKKHVRKSAEFSIQSFLQEKAGWAEATAKRYADALTAEMWPPVLHYAQTPEEMTKMYSSGPSSCMSFHKPENAVLKYRNLSGPAWYAYNPHTKGAYIVGPDGNVLARTILYQNADGSWTSGRIYGEETKLERSLLTAGVHLGGRSYMHPRACTFTVPPVAYQSRLYTPATYFDNIRNEAVRYTFDDEEGVFKWAVNMPKNATRGWREYASSTIPHRSSEDCQSTYECAHCHNTSSQPPLRIPGYAQRYCSRECIEGASGGEYTVGITRAGPLAVVSTSQAVRSIEGTIYVSLLAIQERAQVYQPYKCVYPEAGTETYTDTVNPGAVPTPSTSYPPEPDFFQVKVQRNVMYSPSYRPSKGIKWPDAAGAFGDFTALKTYKLHSSISGMVKAFQPSAALWGDAA